ncbi:nicotinate phosphoribosyltransferase [Rhodoligotrophos appendicifer]|uniref:hypothetical protein n=1 Tax=Rhodoligotrophos appendicifer TaxID=987056 RepID=UPI001961D0D5|nr:hypothetical protein [Rhodoligotrophos appendicifer]
MDQSTPRSLLLEGMLSRIVELSVAAGPLAHQTDKYFSHTRRIAELNGDQEVTYAFFLRRRIVAAIEPALRILQWHCPEARVRRFFEEGEIVPAHKKLIEITGPFSKLAEIETLMLQKIGLPSVCANNAYDMCRALPYAGFLDMHARHATGPEMNLLAAYGASVGSEAARAEDPQVKGFIGSSQDLTAPLYGALAGSGTMPHALIGYTGGDVLEAMKLFADAVPETAAITALVDFQGLEVDDAVRCARWFYDEGRLDTEGRTFGVRLDTHGGRFAQGLDYEKSVEIVGRWLGIEGEYNIVEKVLGVRAFQLDAANILVDQVRRILFGKGVSVANIIHVRRALDAAGYAQAAIVASSGFDNQKCLVMGGARAPVNLVGTGSFLPDQLSETYATADIIAYGGIRRVKVGREYLFD